MSKIEEVILAQHCELSQYDEILYNLNFIEDVLGIKPENVMLSDETKMWHFGCNEYELKRNLFYKYGYELKSTDENLVDVLKQIESNITEVNPLDLHSFWAVPSRLCFSHSHPAKDVFSLDYLSKNIIACEFDVIIELRTMQRAPNSYNVNLFDELCENNNSQCKRITEIIPDESTLSFKQIKEIVDRIDFYMTHHTKVMIHSQGRADRLALILSCWLVKNKLADETNFIDEIASLRLGLWANGNEEEEILDPYNKIELNKTFFWITDETRPYLPNVKRKIRKMMTVPFLFSNDLIKQTKYWEYGILPINYEVDDDILFLIKKFVPKVKIKKSNPKIKDAMFLTIDSDGEVYESK